ncbi:hypothetical protein F442_08423 [Phytophthora nicotianae P10297]|uniref:RxLR effector protein n=2 Tax=Phytophthora nicotianae TaxID=4792 RepID=W2ZCU0_PHYNI|nr:hypothetical protein L916_08246 [Phytophthora nicotianae]ETL93774.1 hypothetical protein L917_08144 [Phytophthora nicotianae]ETP45093.1 hypothetical protein F442_08423 [Phytophthora nicotianae P10297]KUG02080.1 hypothetical protein AM587_10012033 [Phytophthora nicotianae]
MRSCCIALVILALYAAISDAATIPGGSKRSPSGFQPSIRSLALSRHAPVEKVLLRSNSVVGHEERAFAIPGLSKIVEWFKALILKIKLSFSEGKQLSAWLKEKKTPEDVFKLLKLHTGTENLLANKNLKTWSVFMVLYNKENPTKMVTMLGMLTKTYGDEAVAKMIEASRANLKTKPIANRLQNLQLSGWAQNGLSPDIVFQMLKVGEGGVDKLMSNKGLNVWFYFFNQMNRYNPDRQIGLINKLLTVYDDIPLAKAFDAASKVKSTKFMGKELQEAQFKKWLADGIEPSTIFKRLNLDKLKWTTDPNADVYRGYKIYYYANAK